MRTVEPFTQKNTSCLEEEISHIIPISNIIRPFAVNLNSTLQDKIVILGVQANFELTATMLPDVRNTR